MKKSIALIIIVLICFNSVYATQGNNGFEGGISSGVMLGNQSSSKNQKQTYYYKEIVVVTGVPLIFEGNVTLTKAIKDNIETYTYNYLLTNGEKNKLIRTAAYESFLTYEDTQTVRVTSVKTSSKPRETITVDGVTYSLVAVNGRNFSLSTITDGRPACDYYAGELNSEKVYQTGKGRKTTIRMTGGMYGYDQAWGATEIQDIKVSIYGETNEKNIADIWGGEGTIKIITATSNKLSYIENKPDAISFEGGYLKTQENNSILKYNFNLPIFDSKNVATDSVVSYSDTLNAVSFPHQERLAVADTSGIRGHWYEEDIKQLTSLGVVDFGFVTEYTNFNDAITRKEFAKAIVGATSLTLLDLPQKSSRPIRNQPPVEKLPFVDVEEEDEFYKYIYTLYKKGIMTGMSDTIFSPNDPLSRSQAVVIFIRVLGLEAIVQGTNPITSFEDNDEIPNWARNAIVVAAKIGIIKGDERRFLRPNNSLSKAEAATLLNNLINYMREDMAQDYKSSINAR